MRRKSSDMGTWEISMSVNSKQYVQTSRSLSKNSKMKNQRSIDCFIINYSMIKENTQQEDYFNLATYFVLLEERYFVVV
jgi:hypothetical protein